MVGESGGGREEMKREAGRTEGRVKGSFLSPECRSRAGGRSYSSIGKDVRCLHGSEPCNDCISS